MIFQEKRIQSLTHIHTQGEEADMETNTWLAGGKDQHEGGAK